MKAETKTVVVYISDSGKEYSFPVDCLCSELSHIQVAHRAKLDCEPVRCFVALATLISLKPKVLDKLEELAILCGMSPRTKSEKGINQ